MLDESSRGTSVRDFSSGDVAACVEVFETNVPKFFTAEERGLFVDYLHDLPGPYFVLLDPSGRVVACGGYAFNEAERTADMCWGMVRRELHGRGFGETLTRLRIERVEADGRADIITLNTSQHTVGFYERMGFETVEVQADGYAPGLDRCEMRLDLTDAT